MRKKAYCVTLIFVSLFMLSSCEEEQLEGAFFSTPDGSNPEVFCENTADDILTAQAVLLNASPAQQMVLCQDLRATISNAIVLCGDEMGIFQALLDDLGTDCNLDGGGDDDSDDSIINQTYVLTSYTATTEFDLNGDGVFSNDILAESGCLTDERLFFQDDTAVEAISTSVLDIFVDEDTSGNLVQIISCAMIDNTTVITYVQNGDIIVIDDFGEDYTGVISGNQIIFTDPNFFVGQFINDTGDGVVEIDEEVVMIYTRQ